MDQLYIVQQYAICSTLIRKESHTYFDIVVTVLKMLGNAEKFTSRFWVLNRKSNGSFQVSFLFKSLLKNREVNFCVILNASVKRKTSVLV